MSMDAWRPIAKRFAPANPPDGRALFEPRPSPVIANEWEKSFVEGGTMQSNITSGAAAFLLALALSPAPAQTAETPDGPGSALVEPVMAPAKPEAAHPFAAIAGNWLVAASSC